MKLKPLLYSATLVLSGSLLAACSGSQPQRDTTSPTVTLSANPTNVTSAQNVTLTAVASDNHGVTKVEFYEGSKKLGEDVTTPYTQVLSMTASDNGAHTYTAKAYDAAGNTKVSVGAGVQVDISTAGPNMTVTSQTKTIESKLTIEGTVGGARGIQSLSYSLNGGQEQDITTSIDGESYKFQVELSPGDNSVVLQAKDNAGNSTRKEVKVNYLKGNSTIQGTLVDQNIGAAVSGSTVKLLIDGEVVGRAVTSANGTFTFSGVPETTYDLKARKSGFAGSDLYGLQATDGTINIQMIQRPAFDTSATTTPAQLDITRADGTAIRDATFTNGVDFRIKTEADSIHVRPLRNVYAQLGRTPGSSSVTGSATASSYYYPAPADSATVDTGAVNLPNDTAKNFINGFGSAEGEKVYLEVVAYDFNYNYVRYIIPIILKNESTNATNTVVAPTGAAATAFTLKQEGSWTTPNAADVGSGLFVELRWCYNGPVPFAFDIERSADAVNFTKVGRVGGGASTSCSSSNPASRPFFYRDNSAQLAAGKTFTYRVVARGANSEASNNTQTTPLAPFTPDLLGPADEEAGVSVTPTFTWLHPQTAIGADGAAYNLRIRDMMAFSGYNLPGGSASLAYRVEVGTGDEGNKIPTGEVVAYQATVSGTGARPALSASNVLTDTAGLFVASKPQAMPVDLVANTASLPIANLGVTLQTLRPYKWEMYSAYAYKYNQNEGGRISAFSVYTWPSSSTAPIPAARPVTQSFDFTTGQ